jgi:predicted outer membrane repeat protein
VTIDGPAIENGKWTSLGGGIYNNGGTLTVENSVFSGNSADQGGAAISSQRASFTVESSTFSKNKSTGSGGAINVNGGRATVIGSTIAGNQADSFGGGIRFHTTTDPVTIARSTIAGNVARSSGGGIHASGTATVTVEASTIVANTASSGAGISTANTVTLAADIIARQSSGSDCLFTGRFVDAGFNLDDDRSCVSTGQRKSQRDEHRRLASGEAGRQRRADADARALEQPARLDGGVEPGAGGHPS